MTVSMAAVPDRSVDAATPHNAVSGNMVRMVQAHFAWHHGVLAGCWASAILPNVWHSAITLW